ncbi:MAG: hypothetical protein Ct9H300mP25_09190 [Acidobacteriota bacterium]|nr:MAG: hypothetical protein Ct9H300mP25_09190 [Acidobacteriota bacterium]
MYIGFIATNPSFAAPALDLNPTGAPPIFPFVFVVIACGPPGISRLGFLGNIRKTTGE